MGGDLWAVRGHTFGQLHTLPAKKGRAVHRDPVDRQMPQDAPLSEDHDRCGGGGDRSLWLAAFYARRICRPCGAMQRVGAALWWGERAVW